MCSIIHNLEKDFHSHENWPIAKLVVCSWIYWSLWWYMSTLSAKKCPCAIWIHDKLGRLIQMRNFGSVIIHFLSIDMPKNWIPTRSCALWEQSPTQDSCLDQIIIINSSKSFLYELVKQLLLKVHIIERVGLRDDSEHKRMIGSKSDLPLLLAVEYWHVIRRGSLSSLNYVMVLFLLVAVEKLEE